MKLIASTLVLLTLSLGVFAQEKPERTLETTFDSIRTQVANEASPEAIRTTISALIDFPLIARLTVGKTHWMAAEVATREAFITKFTDYLFKSYLDQLPQYINTELSIDDVIIRGDKAKVMATVSSNDQKTQIAFKLYETADTWKLYDMDIAGVSLLKSFRMEFESALKSGGLDALIQSFENK